MELLDPVSTDPDCMGEIEAKGRRVFQTNNSLPIPVAPRRIGPVLRLSSDWPVVGKDEWVSHMKWVLLPRDCGVEGDRQVDMGTGPWQYSLCLEFMISPSLQRYAVLGV